MSSSGDAPARRQRGGAPAHGGHSPGRFEIAFDIDFNVKWELSAEGDVEVDISTRGVMETV